MKTIKSLKDITTLEVDDEVVFGNLTYKVRQNLATDGYYLCLNDKNTPNDTIFKHLKVNKRTFIENIGIKACIHMDFPETKSLEALTAIVSALFKEYEKQNELPKTWEEFCKRNKKNDKRFCLYDGVIIGTGVTQNTIKDTILIESPEEAQAFKALMQLRQLRKCYVGNWEPDWTCRQLVYCVGYNYILNKCVIESSDIWGNCMSFPTHELAKQFLTNFKDLLEVAKQLL